MARGSARRNYVRDARGRFASTPGGGAKKAKPKPGGLRQRQAVKLAKQRGQLGVLGAPAKAAKARIKATKARTGTGASPQQRGALARAKNTAAALSDRQRLPAAKRAGTIKRSTGVKVETRAKRKQAVKASNEATRRIAAFNAKRSKPKETLEFKGGGIKGPSGATLKAYTWQWQWDTVRNKEGDEAGKRVSNWDAAVQSTATGRNVVHQFVIERNGKKSVVSAERALKELGYMGEGAKRFAGLKSALKTYARLQMERAVLQRQMDLVERVRRETKTPKITVRRTAPVPWAPNGQYEIRAGQYSLTETGGQKNDLVDKNGRLTSLSATLLIKKFRDEAIKRVTGRRPMAIASDLQDVTNRLERQQRKIDGLS